MTAGQIGTNRLGTPHHGVRLSRRAAIGSAIVVLALAAAVAVPALVANNGQPAAALPAVAAPTATYAAPSLAAPATPYRVTHELTPFRPGTGLPWGRHIY